MNNLRPGDLIRIDHKDFPAGYRNKLMRVESVNDNGPVLAPVSSREERLLKIANDAVAKFTKFV